MEQQELHFTIGATPSSGATVDPEVRMVKAALLYGDRVKLCSAGAFMMLAMGQIGTINREEQLAFLENMLPVFEQYGKEGASETQELLKRYRKVQKTGVKGVEDQLLVAAVESLLGKMFSGLGKVAHQQARHAGLDPLIAAMNTGLVEIHTFQAGGDTEAMCREYLSLLGEAVADSGTLPLFDDHSGSLVRSAVAESAITVSDTGIARGKHSALAANLLERLPLFEDASIDEIMDIRKELNRPLVRFRAAMLQYSEKIKSAAWDEDFAYEADVVFMRDVHPAILTIEDAVKSNNFLASLARVTDKPLEVAGKSALGYVIATLDFLPDLVAKGLGFGIAGAGITYDVFKQWRKEMKPAEDNQMFFYYRAGQRLEKKVKPRTTKNKQHQSGRRQ